MKLSSLNGMSDLASKRLGRETIAPLRFLADQAFSRAAGAPLVPGNRVRILRDATENYPAWLEAISSATRTIHFESYIIHADDVGQQFADALAAKAREGVRVRLIYDWMGALGAASYRFWHPLRRAGVEVRCFNPPRLDSPFGWLSRDHRKMLSVDGRIGYVTGLCVGRQWVGDSKRGIDPWRDTGMEIQGPAVADLEQAFGSMWALLGPAIPEGDLPGGGESIPASGDVTLRLVASMPSIAGLYRLDQLIAAAARRSIWLTDAYFVGTTPYVQALKAAAMDGVDVRLLVPRASDIPILHALSRAGFRALLEAGIRVFEWNGPMLHAKTAVTDGCWARVGSTNLNLASWLGNWELDVVVEDKAFAQQMEEMYLDDLAHSTEITLGAKHKLRTAGSKAEYKPRRRVAPGSGGRAVAGVLRVGNTVGAAITNRRALGPAEATMMVGVGLLLLALAVIAAYWPPVVALPLAVLAAWVAVSLFVKAHRLYRKDGE